MLRVRTLYAASAGVTAAYYTQYLTESPDDVPGVWTGNQATAPRPLRHGQHRRSGSGAVGP